MCHHYTYEVQTTALKLLKCANTHTRKARARPCSHTQTHTRTDGLLVNGALLFFNERCSRSSLYCPPHYLSVFTLLFFILVTALLYLLLPLSSFHFFIPCHLSSFHALFPFVLTHRFYTCSHHLALFPFFFATSHPCLLSLPSPSFHPCPPSFSFLLFLRFSHSIPQEKKWHNVTVTPLQPQ